MKTYREVGWDYEHLLSICSGCEDKVEQGLISRQFLQEVKQTLRLSFSTGTRVTPHQISLTNNKSIYLGSNHLASTDIVFKYKECPILWFETIGDIRVMNARFYDINGTVISAIDKNQWTADRSRFYDITSATNGGVINLEIIGKRDDTKVSLSLSEKGLTVGPSVFYIPNNKIQILSNGDLMVGTITFSKCGMFGVGAAFAFS